MDEHRFTDPETGESWVARRHDGPISREVIRLAERERAPLALMTETVSHLEEKVRQAEARERKLREALLTAIPQAVADRLLTNGGGEVGARLVIEGPAQEDFGGWCRSAVEDATRGVLRALLKEE